MMMKGMWGIGIDNGMGDEMAARDNEWNGRWNGTRNTIGIEESNCSDQQNDTDKQDAGSAVEEFGSTAFVSVEVVCSFLFCWCSSGDVR